MRPRPGRGTVRQVAGEPRHAGLSSSPILDAGEQVAGLGRWECVVGSDEVVWSDNLYRIFGLEPGMIAPTLEFILEQTHPDDRQRVSSYLEMRPSVAEPQLIEYRIHPVGRGVRYLRSTMTALDPGARGAKRIVAVVQDVTEERLASREIAAHVAVARALEDWDSFEDGGKRLLRDLAEAMEFASGALWLPEHHVLTARFMWSAVSLSNASEFEAATLSLRISRGFGPLGRAWETQLPVITSDVLSDRDYQRGKAAARAGLHGAVAFPAVHAGEVLAVIDLYYQEESQPTPRFTETMRALGYELGEFLRHRRGQLHPLPLSARELQVLQLAADGSSGPDIAARLGISNETVRSHMKHMNHKLGVNDRAGAVAVGIRLGLIE